MGYVVKSEPVSKGAAIAVGVGFVALFMLLSGAIAYGGIKLMSAHVEAGKRYRFFFKVSPAMPRNELETAITALTGSGIANIDSSTSATETRVSYELTSTVTKDIVLNQPMVRFGQYNLIPLKVEELS